MRRAIKITGLSLIALPVLLILSLCLILGTQAGSRWALGLVPGLKIENFSGHLAGQWRADHLLWVQGDSRVEVDAPVFVWSPLCLAKMTLCVDQLQAERVGLQFPSGADQSSGPMSLPDLKLPLAIRLGDVRIGSLMLNGSEQLRALQLAAEWTANGLQINAAHLQRDDLVLDLSGLLQPNGDWPLTAQGQLKLDRKSVV